MITESDLAQYIEFPIESFSLEIKTWIDSKSDKGIAKIVKACMALRNSNGGMLIIGLSDDKQLGQQESPTDVFTDFEQDYIQGLISKYASIPFEIEVRFSKKNQFNIPVIIVPSGFKTPVAIKKELKIDGHNVLIKLNAIYVRTLSANNIVSTAEASGNDWDRLMSLCFENRESDIGQFIRRHLTPENIALLSGQIGDKKDQPFIDPSNLNLGYESFESAANQNGVLIRDIGYFEVSFAIVGQVLKAHEADQNFLNLIASANRRLTGWPFWVDSRGFADEESHPYVLNSGWQALIPSEFYGNRIDFWRMTPSGLFYAIRSLDDDGGADGQPTPKTVLDPYLAIWRVAEVLMLAVAFANAISYINENSNIYVNLRWSGLENRKLSQWSSNDFLFLNTMKTKQNIVESQITMQTDIADTAIFQYVEKAIKPLINIFGGENIPTPTIEKICMKLINQKY